MSVIAVEVELDHGRVTPKGTACLPEKAVALLIILESESSRRDPLICDPELRVKFFEDPAIPLDAKDWPSAY